MFEGLKSFFNPAPNNTPSQEPALVAESKKEDPKPDPHSYQPPKKQSPRDMDAFIKAIQAFGKANKKPASKEDIDFKNLKDLLNKYFNK